MKLFFVVISFVVFSLLCGCSPPKYMVKTDATNYREKLIIKKINLTFYNGEYIGPEKNCFPPIANRICVIPEGGEVYKPDKKLKMEAIEIRIKDTTAMISKVVKDMAYLTAAELAEQLGYKTFTVTETVENISCGLPSNSVNTHGNMVGSSYYGSSTRSENTICSNQFSIIVLMYDEQEDLKLGVLSLRTGQSRIGTKRSLLSPYKNLYSGTSPGLYEENLKREQIKSQLGKYDSLRNLTLQVPKNAWKINYDIKGLAGDLRKQYEITEKLSYNFEELRDLKKELTEPKQVDPLDKYKIAE